jgi:dTDP-4-amino-4,6-dideoxygalactose transaminase
MSLDIQPLVVRLEDSLATAMQSLESTGKGIVLLVGGAQGQLIQVLTDGDIRRLILSGASLDAPLSTLPRRRSFSVPVGTTGAEAIAFMDAHSIDQLPVVDGQGRPVDVLLRRDLSSRIFLSSPHIGEEELQFVAEAFRTNMIAPLGPNVDAFETELAKRVGIGHAAALSSGTAALHVGLRLLGVDRGDTVFCSSLTFVASANPILYQGATPVFIDSEPDSWNMSAVALERAFEDAKARGTLPKAVLVVNLYGQSADMDRIVPLCDAYGVPMLEDAAESLGATYKGRHSGTFGKLGVYSFNGNKIITTSGGGMLVSSDAELISRARYLSTQAREPALHYEHVEIGYNYRMSNVLAGIGRGQLGVLDSRVQARRGIFERYRDALSDVSAIEWMPEPASGMSNRWLTACTLRGGISPVEVIKSLAKLDIEARPVWKPMHRQPLFAAAEYVTHGENYDCSGDLYDRGLCLPSGSNMTDSQVERVCNAVRTAIAQNR